MPVVSVRHLLAEKMVAEDGKGGLAGAVADHGAIAEVGDGAGEDALRVGETEADGADRLGGRAAVGAGDAGDGEGEVGAGEAAGVLGHLTDDRFGDGAVLIEGLLADAEDAGLGLVGVGDEAFEEIAAGAGNVGEHAGEQAAGAAFGGGDGLAALL